MGISLAYALPRFGLFVGQNVAQLLGVGSTADFVRTTAVAFFLLYLILMVIWMVNSHERKRAESQARAADELLGRFAQEQESVRKLRCDALADDHGLTNREKDILYLLAQGRDLAFICETLFLSKNTVKSYQKTIYAKLDVLQQAGDHRPRAWGARRTSPLKQAHPEVRFNDSSPITPGRAPHLKGGFAVSRFGWGARARLRP